MDQKSIFNVAVCIIGIAILLIHVIDLVLKKKEKRNDEKNLLAFLIFTVVHFSTYLIYTFIKVNHSTDALVMSFYTTFYIMNNVELLFLLIYALSYISIKKKTKEIITIINFILFVSMVVLLIINVFTHMFFYAENGVYTRSRYMFFSQAYQFEAFTTVFILAISNKKLSISEKIAFSFYCILPLIAIVIQNFMPGYAIAYLSIVISIEILFLFINVKKNLLIAEEAKRVKEAEVKIMMSQIQPHFVYNTLASISTLIKINPDKAQSALDAFTEYLRRNLSSLSSTGLISFNDELKHVKTYLELEQMRFSERLTVQYDIRVTDFLVPPLTIQPLVENAVKHGILKNIEGGVISIMTYEDDKAYYVRINDDGVGFDVNDEELKDPKHVGLRNVKYRLMTMSNASLTINSEIDKGTDIVVTFNKEL